MNTRLLIRTGLAAGLLLGAIGLGASTMAIGATDPWLAQPDDESDGHSGDEAFERHMKATWAGLRRVRRSEFNAESRAADLGHIDTLQAGLVGAKQQFSHVSLSEAAQKKFGADTAAYHEAFRRKLHQALAESVKLEAAVLKGDVAAAKKSVSALITMRNDGHDMFRDDE